MGIEVLLVIAIMCNGVKAPTECHKTYIDCVAGKPQGVALHDALKSCMLTVVIK